MRSIKVVRVKLPKIAHVQIALRKPEIFFFNFLEHKKQKKISNLINENFEQFFNNLETWEVHGSDVKIRFHGGLWVCGVCGCLFQNSLNLRTSISTKKIKSNNEMVFFLTKPMEDSRTKSKNNF